MTLANCLNLPCRIFKQFACFSDAFKSSLKKKKDSVKYFNKPKPCGIFFRCLNCTPLTPVHPPTLLFWLAFSQHFFFSVCPFAISLWVLSHQLICGYIFPPQIVLTKHTHTHRHKIIFTYSTNPVVGIYDNNS